MLIGYARISMAGQDLSTAGCLEQGRVREAGHGQGQRSKNRSSWIGRGAALCPCRGHAGDLEAQSRGLLCTGAERIPGEISARGIDFRSLTDGFDTSTAAGRLLFHILASVAEMERELIKERTIAGLAAARPNSGNGGGRKPLLIPDLLTTARVLLAGGDKPDKVARLLKVGRSTLYRRLAKDPMGGCSV